MCQVFNRDQEVMAEPDGSLAEPRCLNLLNRTVLQFHGHRTASP